MSCRSTFPRQGSRNSSSRRSSAPASTSRRRRRIQLGFVTTKEPYLSQGLFEAVTGTFGTAATGTQLAEIGYALSAERIEPYE
jgi:hypothetical protein